MATINQFPKGHGISTEMRHCLESCLRCHATCVETVNHCLGVGGLHAEPAHITLLMSCGEIARCAAELILMGSGYHEELCNLCAEACRHCAGNCSGIVQGDERLQRCAEACLDCAEQCEALVGY